MLDKLKKYNRLNETLFLFVLSTGCFSITVFRAFYAHSKQYLFLNWNLFLAFMPWILSSLMIINPELRRKKPVIFLLLISWLVFFPNAPYILTDLFHLCDWGGMPQWFDLLMILCFSWTGLLFGFLSLWDIETLFKNRINPKIIPFLSSAFLFVGGFGVYAGRYLRWNSWDIIRRPLVIMGDITERVINPTEHKTWAVTFFMGLFLNIIYWSFRFIRTRENDININS